MIVGIGIDLVDIPRFAETITRNPAILERILGASEIRDSGGDVRSPASLAARFAAKEALAKALGAPAGLSWHDAAVVMDEAGKPSLMVAGSVAARAAELGVDAWHLSLSHDGGSAVAMVVAERRDSR